MIPPILWIGGLLAVGFVLAGKSAPRLVVGHRYKFTFRANISKQGTPFGSLDALTKQLASLGWSTVLLEPSDADVDQFVWRATGIWSGSPPAMHDSASIKFLGSPTDLDAIPQAHAFDRSLPADLELTTSRMLASDNDANDLWTFAQSLRPDYPLAASALETKAAALNVSAQTGAPPPPTYPAPAINVQTQPPAQVSPQPPPAPPFSDPTPPPAAGSPNIVTLPEITVYGDAPADAPAGPAPSAPWNPGPLPALPPIPAHLQAQSAANMKAQNALVSWAGATNALQTTGLAYGVADVDGMVGPHTQAVTQVFQAWSNQFRGLALQPDGLFGANTDNALSEWGG